MSKKLISLALVVMMLVAFVPATLFTAGAQGTDEAWYMYFNSKYMIDKKGGGHVNAANTIAAMTYANTKGEFEFYKAGGQNGSSFVTSNFSSDGNMATSYSRFAATAVGDWMAFKVNSPVVWSDAYYNPAAHPNYSKGATLHGYFLPADADLSNIETALESYIARLKFSGTAETGKEYDIVCDGTSKSFKLEVAAGKDLTEKEYIFVLRVAEKGSNFNICPGFFTNYFNSTNAYIGSVSASDVTVGGTATATAAVYAADTDAVIDPATAGGTLTFSTPDTDVIDLDPETGVYTAKKNGTAKITATYSDATRTRGSIASKTITVAEPGYRFKYDFSKSGVIEDGVTVNGTELKPTPNTQQTTYYYVNSIKDYAMTYGAWKFHGASKAESGNVGVGVADAIFVFKPTDTNRYVAYDINVPVGGTFDVTLSYGGAPGVKTDYFLVPAGTDLSNIATADQDPNAKILAEDFTGANFSTNPLPNTVTLEQGEYIFVCRLNDEATGSGDVLSRIKGLEMKTHDAATLNDAYVGTIDPISVEKDKTAEANVRIYNAYNHAQYEGGVTLRSEKNEIATVEGKNVTGVAGGTTKLTATLDDAEGNIIPGTITVVASGYRFKYDFKSSAMREVTELNLKYKMHVNRIIEYSITDYAMTYGAWKFRGTSHKDDYDSGFYADGVHKFNQKQTGRYVAYDINVPVSGTFDVTLYNEYAGDCFKTDYFLLPKDSDLSKIPELTKEKAEAEGGITLAEDYLPVAGTGETIPDVYLEKGEYIFVMRLNEETEPGSATRNCRISYIEMTESGASQWKDAYVGTIDSVSTCPNETGKTKARVYNAYTREELTEGVNLSIKDGTVASLADDLTVTGIKEGVTEITATIEGKEYNVIPGTLTVENKALTDGYNGDKTTVTYAPGAVSAVTYLKDSETSADLTVGVVENGDNKYTLTAPTEEGYTFLYWAKGLATEKRILGFDTELAYIRTNDSNSVIAVYEKEDADVKAKAEFYAGDGQLVATLTENGETAPELPGIPGRTATGWKNTAGTIIGVGDAVTLGTGTQIWVAQYSDPIDVKVTAKNATGAKASYKFGELVTLEADVPAGQTFLYWTKTVDDGEPEIVGFKSRTYSFYAWENCTVTAVYGEEAPVYNGGTMKILIDTIGEGTSVMAEFIGFDVDGVSILEKGISLGGTDYAMATDKMQFILSDIGEAAATGYVIFKDSTGIYRINDK